MYLKFVHVFALGERGQCRFTAETGAHPSDLCSQTVIQFLLDRIRKKSFQYEDSYRGACGCVRPHSDLVVSIKLLVLSLTLPEGLPLGFQRLGQVGVFQALL